MIFIKTIAMEHFHGGPAFIPSLIYSSLVLSYVFGRVFQTTAFKTTCYLLMDVFPPNPHVNTIPCFRKRASRC